MTYNDRILLPGYMEDGRDSLPRNYARSWPQRDPKELKGVVLHQSLEDYGGVWGNAKYHTGPNHISNNGLPGLSYTIFIDRSTGRAVLANDVECATYSQGNSTIVGNENERYLSICVGGNFAGPGYVPGKKKTLTSEQNRVMHALWHHLAIVFDFTGAQLYGHYHFGKPACPGYEIAEFVETIRQAHYGSFTDELDLSNNSGRQALLAKLGFYQAEIDGEWGPQSKYALVQCQAMLSMKMDGVWGVKTEELILEELS